MEILDGFLNMAFTAWGVNGREQFTLLFTGDIRLESKDSRWNFWRLKTSITWDNEFVGAQERHNIWAISATGKKPNISPRGC